VELPTCATCRHPHIHRCHFEFQEVKSRTVFVSKNVLTLTVHVFISIFHRVTGLMVVGVLWVKRKSLNFEAGSLSWWREKCWKTWCYSHLVTVIIHFCYIASPRRKVKIDRDLLLKNVMILVTFYWHGVHPKVFKQRQRTWPPPVVWHLVLKTEAVYSSTCR